MTIKEVCEKYNITADTLRYYEKVGAIPKVNRTNGGTRNYTEEDFKWIHNAICLRDAGVSVESIAKYVKLFKKGDKTIKDRLSLLEDTKKEILEEINKYDEALKLLDFKISRYKKAVKTGVLDWSRKE